jgi:hypothetical protein
MKVLVTYPYSTNLVPPCTLSSAVSYLYTKSRTLPVYLVPTDRSCSLCVQCRTAQQHQTP